MIEIMQREIIAKHKIIEIKKNVKITSLTEDRIEKLIIMINDMKANSMNPNPNLFLQIQKTQDKKEKLMVTAIVVLSIFVICLFGSTYYCCHKYVIAYQTAVTINTINETKKKYQVIKQNMKVMRLPIK